MYQLATVSANDGPNQTYVGLTANTFKTRFNNHKTSFKNPSKKHCTELSKHVRKLKDDRVNFNIKWRILKQAKPYSNASNKCNLSLWEKYFIICNPTMASRNKRNKLVSSSRHAKAFLLRNFITETIFYFYFIFTILTIACTFLARFNRYFLCNYALATTTLYLTSTAPLRHETK